MAADYQVIAFHDTAPITRVDIFASEPLTLAVTGTSFVGVARILINGVESPEYVVVSQTRLLAQVPVTEVNARLRSVRVVLSRSHLAQTTAVDLESVVPGVRATGFTKLLQAYLRALLTNPGEDLANPWFGGGLYRLVGGAGSVGELRAAAAKAVGVAEQHLFRLQVRNPSLEDGERLRSVTLLHAEYQATDTALALRLSLTAMDGTTGNPFLSV